MHIMQFIEREVTSHPLQAIGLLLLGSGIAIANLGMSRPGIPDVVILSAFLLYAFIYAKQTLLLYKKPKRTNRQQPE